MNDNTGFNAEQYAALYPDGIENHYWNEARNKIIEKAVNNVNIKGGKILEIGCGKGIVVDYLNKHNFDTYGIELAKVAPMPIIANKVQTGRDVQDLTTAECSQFTTVLLLDVIEHLPEPEVFLLQIKSQFPHLKTIVFTVPARQELFSNYDEFNGHFRRYDLAMMRQLADKIEAKRLWQTYFFHLLYWPARLTLCLFGKRKLYMNAPSKFGKPIHRLLALCMYFDFLFFPKKWRGSSIISIFYI